MNFDHLVEGKYNLVWVDINIATAPSHVTTWLETTRELRKLGWHVTLVLGGPSGQQCIQGVDVLCIPKSQRYLVGYMVFHLQFLHFVLQEWHNIDVILFHPMSAAWLIPLRFKRKVLGSKKPLLLMDTRDRDPVGGTIKNQLRALYGTLASWLANRWVDGQTAITERMAKLVQIPNDQLWGIWPSGVNLEQFFPAQEMRMWPEEGMPIRLVYIGALLHERNLLPMCEAVETVNTDKMKFEFLLYGDGDARAELEAFAIRTNGRIKVLPPIPHEQIPFVLAQAHVGVTSLFFTEQELFQASSPIKLFEYMASGLPILATRMPCHSDVVGEGNYVFWVDEADKAVMEATLQLIWDSQIQLSEMGSQAANAARGWTWRASAIKLKRALEHGLELSQ